LNQALVLVGLLCAYESSFGRAICLTEWRIQGGQSGRAWMPPPQIAITTGTRGT